MTATQVAENAEKAAEEDTLVAKEIAVALTILALAGGLWLLLGVL